MINITFSEKGGQLTAFKVSGHGTSDADDAFGKIVCAAVSSAVYLTANTLTEIVGAKVDCRDSGDVFSLKLLSKFKESEITMQGFFLHVSELSKEYPKNITVSSEV